MPWDQLLGIGLWLLAALSAYAAWKKAFADGV